MDGPSVVGGDSLGHGHRGSGCSQSLAVALPVVGSFAGAKCQPVMWAAPHRPAHIPGDQEDSSHGMDGLDVCSIRQVIDTSVVSFVSVRGDGAIAVHSAVIGGGGVGGSRGRNEGPSCENR